MTHRQLWCIKILTVLVRPRISIYLVHWELPLGEFFTLGSVNFISWDMDELGSIYC